MNETKLKRLLNLMQDSDIEELEVQHSVWRGTRIRISRTSQVRQQAGPSPAPAHAPASAPPTAVSGPDTGVKTDAAETGTQANAGPVIVSPMVGTFYTTSSPEAPPYVSVGDTVHIGQTVCIIEAMKIMNEIQAEVEGEVVEILVANGEPVEFNQPMIQLRSS